MSSKFKFCVLNVLGLVFVSLLISANAETLAFKIFTSEIKISLSLVLSFFYIVGLSIGIISMFPLLSGKQKENLAKLKAWQDQDQKLAIEVQSDKEKQLEAKIASLEVALKQALKR